jgi:hypothetical protein
MKTKTNTERILVVMNILTWTASIGLMIQAGIFLFAYALSFVNSEAARNIYGGLNLHDLRERDFTNYTVSILFAAALPALKANALLLLAKILSEVKLASPFALPVVQKIKSMSLLFLAAWVVSVFKDMHYHWLMDQLTSKQNSWGNGELLYMAGLVFIISQILKRGVEMQSENELTV